MNEWTYSIIAEERTVVMDNREGEVISVGGEVISEAERKGGCCESKSVGTKSQERNAGPGLAVSVSPAAVVEFAEILWLSTEAN